MTENFVIVGNKQGLLNWLSKLPDDAIIIQPTWDLHGQIKCPTPKYPNPSIDVRLNLAQELIIDSDKTIHNLRKLNFIPIFWVAGDKIPTTLTENAIELAHKE